MRATKPLLILGMMLALMLALAVAAAGLGAMRLTLSDVWHSTGDGMLWQIWFSIRLPRVALALLAVGMSVVLPFTLTPIFALYSSMAAAFIGSLAVTVVIFSLSSFSAGLARLLLAGIAINALCGAATGVLSWLSNDQQLRQLSLWGMGSLGQAQWPAVAAAASLILPAALLVQRLSTALNVLQLGEEEAHYLGVDVKQIQRRLLLSSALLVAAAVAVSGVIGFVGLVVPHLIRMTLGDDHRWLLPGATLAGAILLLADTVARTAVAPAEMPVGLLTSLLGGPWFLWLILRRREAAGV